MTEAQFWGLLVSIIALGLGVLRMIHSQNQRIDDISKEQEDSLKILNQRIEELNRNEHHTASVLREEINSRDSKAHTRITQNQLEAEKRYATKDGVEKAIDRVVAQIEKTGNDLKSQIEKVWDHNGS